MRSRAGFNLIEVMIAMSVAATVILGIGAFITSSFRSSATEKDRAFAMQRALQMMEEIAAYKQTVASDPTVDQKFNQAAGAYSFTLTTEDNAVPYQALSGNPKINGNYKYVRHIDALPLANDKNTVSVTVSVYYADRGTNSRHAKPLAVVSNQLHVSPGGVGAAQAIDVYVISIENMPHVYRKQDGASYGEDYYIPSATEARLAFEQSLRSFQGKNPGITFRTHYITRLSVGRDAEYKPYLNDGAGLATGTRDPLKWAYTYPAKLDSSLDSSHYYDPATIAGNITVGDASGNPTVRPGAYPLADQFNHCVPFAQEFDTGGNATGTDTIWLPQQGSTPVSVANTVSTAVNSPLSLRQFLEDMLQDTTGKYKNAVVVNLHGELFPGLPLRPYADPAKDPGDTNVAPRSRRIVTHSYKLNNAVGDVNDPVRLEVYPFMDNGQDTPHDPDNKIAAVQIDNTRFPAYAQSAMIRIRGIKPYIDSAGIPVGSILGDPIDAVTIQLIQRERENGPDWNMPYPPLTGSSGDTKAYYTTGIAWPTRLSPSSADFAYSTDQEEGPETTRSGSGTSARNWHSGPHLASSHALLPPLVVPTSAPYPATPVKYPHWEGNDLVIELKDMDYDCHLVQDDDAPRKYSGLLTDQDALLHGLQYFPDPYLAYLDVAKDSDHYARNSARVLIDFPLKASAAGKRFEVVTQLKKFNRDKTDTKISTANPPTPPASNMGNFLDYINNPQLIDDATVSRSYFYAGATWNANQAMFMGTSASTYRPTIPWTDQVQLVGDPRHNPFYDLRFGDASMSYVAPNLNLYFSNFTQGQYTYYGVTNSLSTYTYKGKVINRMMDEVSSFESVPTTSSSVTVKTKSKGGSGKKGGTTTYTVTDQDVSFRQSHDAWNATKFNGPAYFRMWREAILRNGLVMVNPAGQPFGYIGLGGDFSLKGTINDSATIQTSGNLYSASTSAANGKDEFGADVPLIYREDDRSDSTWPSEWNGSKGYWVAKPWLGELYPSFTYGTRNEYKSGWAPYGNIPAGGSSSAKDLFRHQSLSGINNLAWDGIADKSSSNNTKTIDSDAGLTAFLNNPADVSRTTSSDTTSVTSLGAAVADSFRTQFNALRSWYPFEIGTGTATTEYGDGWIAGLRDSSPAYVTGSPFVGHAKGSPTWTSSRALMLKDSSSKAPFSGNRRGFVYLNTFRPETYDKVTSVFDNAVLGMVQTFYDAAATSLGGNNLKALPRVTITQPALADVLKLPNSPATLSWNQEWLRPDGKQYQTTATYPGTPPAPASGGPYNMAYYVKYRNLTTGGAWQMAKVTGGASVSEPITAAVPGPYDPGVAPPSSVAQYNRLSTDTTGTLSWNYSSLAPGDYLLRIEAYRKDSTLPAPSLLGAHYAYHEIRVTITN